MFSRCDFLRSLSVLGLLCVFGGAGADSKAYSGSNANEKNTVDYQKGIETSCERASSCDFGGFYFGAGLSWMNSKRQGMLSDNIATYPGENENENTNAKDRDRFLLMKKSKKTFGGSVFVGYGVMMGDCAYFGLEGSLDLGMRRKSMATIDSGWEEDVYEEEEEEEEKTEYKEIWNTSVKSTGFDPALKVRVGGTIKELGCLIYATCGVAYLKEKFLFTQTRENGKGDFDVKVSKVVPVLGLGAEKIVYRPNNGKLSIRLEWEHRFKAEKKGKVNENGTYWSRLDGESRGGDQVRLLLVYNCGD